MPLQIRRQLSASFSALAGLLLALITTFYCRASAGVSLGLFFGGVAAATLIVPPLVAGESHFGKRWLVSLASGLGVMLVWLTALGESLTLTQWLACSLAVLAYAAALCGMTALLVTARVHTALAAGAVTVVALLWLTWPVWLSAQLRAPSGDTLVEWLVPAHPLFAINGVLAHFDTWDRRPLAYSRLTVLNQDVFYALPRGVTWTTLVHALLATIAAGMDWWIQRRRRRTDPASALRYAAA